MQIGRYEVVRPLKAGGMARALLCRAPDGRLVVAKLPLERDDKLFARMRDEARVGTRVVHEHLVETLDLVEHEGKPALVVGYVEGASMNELRVDGPLPPAAVARVGWQIASCLHALHEATDASGAALRVIHRDVSGGNILVDKNGNAVLIDLGIAKFDHGRSAHTETGSIVGTARYLAPELLEEESYTPSSDLWALACVLAEASTGRPLFFGNTRESIARISRFKGTHDLDLAGVDDGIARILSRVLVRDASARATAPELVELLRAREDALGGGAKALAARVTPQAVSSTIGADDLDAATAIEGLKAAGAGGASDVFTSSKKGGLLRPLTNPNVPRAVPRKAARPALVVAALGLLTAAIGVGLLMLRPTGGDDDAHATGGATATPTPAPPRKPRAHGPATPTTSTMLTGPDGATLAVPVHGPLIVNVWHTQGLREERRTFVAWRDLVEAGELGSMSVVNVTGVAPDLALVQSFHLDTGLVVDDGGRAFIRPYDVLRFMTLVFDKDGAVVARLHPDAPHFADDLRAAWLRAGGDPMAALAPDVRAVLAALTMREKMSRLETCHDACAAKALADKDALTTMDSSTLEAWRRGVDACLVACGLVH